MGANSLPMFNFYRCMSWETKLKIDEQTKIEKGLSVVMPPSSLYTCISSGQKSPTSSKQKSHNKLSSKIILLLLTDNSLKSSFSLTKTKNWKQLEIQKDLSIITMIHILNTTDFSISKCFLLLVPKRFLWPKAVHHNKI